MRECEQRSRYIEYEYAEHDRCKYTDGDPAAEDRYEAGTDNVRSIRADYDARSSPASTCRARHARRGGEEPR